METFFSWGIQKKIFFPEDVAELIFGKLVTKVDNIDLEAKTGTKFIIWEMHNCTDISREVKCELFRKMRGDLHDPNYDFVLPRILCALGYRCVTKEPAADMNHTLINWDTIFTVVPPKMHNADIYPLREILVWHDCEMPYTHEEVSLIQRVVASEKGKREDLFDNSIYWMQLRKDIEIGLQLRWQDMTSGMLHYVNRMIDFLINIRYTAEQAR